MRIDLKDIHRQDNHIFVDFKHEKLSVDPALNPYSLSSHKTICTIFGSDNKVISAGIALCSLKDNFCKATGRKIALKRAIAKTITPHLPKFDYEDRKAIWQAYFEYCPPNPKKKVTIADLFPKDIPEAFSEFLSVAESIREANNIHEKAKKNKKGEIPSQASNKEG